jgi:putative chitinase
VISTTQLREAMPYAKPERIAAFIQPLNDAMDEFGVTTPARQAAFLAQMAHESASLRYTLEIASGDAYEGREDLGNRQPGDGRRYKGRGLIQVTGRANYAACGIALVLNLIEHPELLEAPAGACRSAGWFWQRKGLNRLADEDKFGSITKLINGGYNGLDDRLSHWLKARSALGVT